MLPGGEFTIPPKGHGPTDFSALAAPLADEVAESHAVAEDPAQHSTSAARLSLTHPDPCSTKQSQGTKGALGTDGCRLRRGHRMRLLDVEEFDNEV